MFSAAELQKALAGQMGGAGVKKGFAKDAWDTTKTGVVKAAKTVGGILPVTQNQMKREVGKLEENDAQNMAVSLLVMERLGELGIDLGITNEDILEKQTELLDNYRERKADEKALAKEARKMERMAKAAEFKQQFFMNKNIVEDEDEIVEIKPQGGASGFDEPADDEEDIIQPTTTYVFKGQPEED